MYPNIPQPGPVNPTNAAPATPQQPVSNQTAPQVVPPPSAEGSSGGKLVMIFVIGLIVIALSVGGVYLYLNQKQAADLANSKVEDSTGTAAPVVQREENLQEELNSINIATDEADFATVDQDIQGL